MSFQGSCHCGKTKYEVEGEIQNVLECNCSICTQRGYLLWFVPRSQLRLSTPESNLAVYTFNKHVIKHFFCPVCGSAPFGQANDPKTGTPTAAINIRCLDGIDLSKIKRIPYDGRSK